MLNMGDRAPNFSLPSTNGTTRSLEEFRGKKVVLYFYPKDETSGCTREACDFRDNMSALAAHGVVVLGVSKDTLESHHAFIANHGLPFELLSDTDNTVSRTYGAWGLKNMYGQMVEGTIRSTFLIDEYGVIHKIWSPVKVDGHVHEVLAAIDPSWVAPTADGGMPTTTKAKATKKPAAKKTTRAKPRHLTNASPRASGRGKKTAAKPATKKGGKAKAKKTTKVTKKTSKKK